MVGLTPGAAAAVFLLLTDSHRGRIDFDGAIGSSRRCLC